jgi:hypothetical protein
METNPSPSGILYSPGQIGLAAFLGSPVAACWFMAGNYRELGQPGTARTWMIWGIVGTVALFTVNWFLPAWIPNSAIPVGYTIGFLNAAKQTHGSATSTDRLVATGRRLAPWWKVSGISLLFFILIVALCAGIVFGIDRMKYPGSP